MRRLAPLERPGNDARYLTPGSEDLGRQGSHVAARGASVDQSNPAARDLAPEGPNLGLHRLLGGSAGAAVDTDVLEIHSRILRPRRRGTAAGDVQGNPATTKRAPGFRPGGHRERQQ